MNRLGVQTRDAGAAVATAPDDLMLSLLHVAHAIEQRLEGALAATGLSWAKYGVLSQLAEAGEPVTLSELAQGSSCVRSNMTQLIDRLEVDGLVRRVDDPADRRIVRAALTALGAVRQDEGAKQIERVQAEFAASLRKADREALKRLLSVLK
jgi:DNA-binding MarR family transcriptional regulator